MGILQPPSVLPGQVGVIGAMKYMVSTDTLATITTAAYLNNIDLSVYPILPNDVLGVTYSYNLQTNSGTFGIFTVSISNGTITLTEWSDPANVLLPVVSGNVPEFNGITGQIKDSGIAAANIQTSALSNPDNISDVIWYDVTCTAAALTSSGKVNVQVSSGTKQYVVRNVYMNYATSGLGGGGNRLLALTDGTTVYNNAGITAALLETPINTVWGGSGNPLPGTVAIDTPTQAGANLYFQLTGGSADYTTGTVIISVQVQRVA